MSSNSNNFDFFNSQGEIFPFIKGKAGTNNFDFFNPQGEVFQGILQDEVQAAAPPVPSVTAKRRIFLIE